MCGKKHRGSASLQDSCGKIHFHIEKSRLTCGKFRKASAKPQDSCGKTHFNIAKLQLTCEKKHRGSASLQRSRVFFRKASASVQSSAFFRLFPSAGLQESVVWKQRTHVRWQSGMGGHLNQWLRMHARRDVHRKRSVTRPLGSVALLLMYSGML